MSGESISDDIGMLLQLKDRRAVDKGDETAKMVWENMITSEQKNKINGEIRKSDPGDFPVIMATPQLRNIYAWTAGVSMHIHEATEMQDQMIKKIKKTGIEKLNNYDTESLKREGWSEHKGCILFSHQRDEGFVFWCPNTIINKDVDMPMGKAWPNNSKLIDTFDF